MAPSRPERLKKRASSSVTSQTRTASFGVSPTFAGADHLENHLRRAPVVQPGLLIQHLLLLHFLFLQAKTDRRFQRQLTGKLRDRGAEFHLKRLLLSFLLGFFFSLGAALEEKV